jgi:hypothetical protein
MKEGNKSSKKPKNAARKRNMSKLCLNFNPDGVSCKFRIFIDGKLEKCKVAAGGVIRAEEELELGGILFA